MRPPGVWNTPGRSDGSSGMRDSSNSTQDHLHWIRCPFQIVRHLEKEKGGGLVAGLGYKLSQLSISAETPLSIKLPLYLTGAFGPKAFNFRPCFPYRVSLPLSPSAPSATPAWRVGLLEVL